MEIYDDAVDILDQIHIKQNLFGINFPWFFVNDVTEVNGFQKRPAFCHNFMHEGKVNSPHFHLVEMIVNLAERASKRKFEQVLHSRSFCQLPLSQEIIGDGLIDQFHIDREEPHTAILYYVNDYDGETIISDTCFDYTGSNVIDTKTHKFNVVKKVKAMQGRLLVFDGKYYHTANQPRLNHKCIININVI